MLTDLRIITTALILTLVASHDLLAQLAATDAIEETVVFG